MREDYVAFMDSVLQAKAFDLNMRFHGYPELRLVESAGKGIAEKLEKLLIPLQKKKKKLAVLFLIGPGNNGADGLAAIKFLKTKRIWKKLAIHCYLLDAGRNFRQNTRAMLAKADRLIGKKLAEVPGTADYEVVVESLFGTGFSGRLQDKLRSFLRDCRARKRIAIDVPTAPFKPHTVISIHTRKRGDAELVELEYPKKFDFLTGPGDLLLLNGFGQGHKGMNGKVLLVAGSAKYLGSLYFSAYAASHFCDLVYYYCPEQKQGMANELPEAIQLGFEQAEKMLWNNDFQSLCIGPGIDKHNAGAEALLTLALAKKIKTVVDAGGLELLKGKKLGNNVVLTPHAEEFRRAFNLKPTKSNCKAVAKKLGCIVLLKGKTDLIATPDGKLFLNLLGNPGMTKGGTGDALAGLIAGLMAKNDALLSAKAGVFLLTHTADELAKELGFNYSVRQLIDALPKVYNRLMRF